MVWLGLYPRPNFFAVSVKILMRLTNFIHQKAYEHIEYRVRRSLITLVPTALAFIVLSALPMVVWWFLNRLFPLLLAGPILFPLAALFGSVYYLSLVIFFYSYFIDFYLDLLVVTNDRLIDIEQRGLFSRTISEVDLYQVQDVTSEVNGLFPSLFRYGQLTVQTAGPVGHFVVRDVPNPNALRRAILDLADKDRRYHNAS